MKAGPVLAMIALILVGMWLVLQPTLSRADYDYELRVGAVQLRAERTEAGYRFVEPARLGELGDLTPGAFMDAVDAERAAWDGIL